MDLLSKYKEVRARSEYICRPLQTEDYVVQPVVDVSPPKWHLGHTTWFFETFVLTPNAKHYRVFDEAYNFVFNSYYETIGARVIRTDRGNLSRPTVADIYRYRTYVDEAMSSFLAQELPKEIHDIVVLGLNHEEQHQELLATDIKYILGNNPLLPAYAHEPDLQEQVTGAAGSEREAGFQGREAGAAGSVEGAAGRGSRQRIEGDGRSGEMIDVPAGIYEIGYAGDGFCFDNELGRHKVYLRDYKIAHRPVTNGEYLDFINEGGYHAHEYWHAEGLDWVKTNHITAPMYWHNVDGVWHHYTEHGLVEIDWGDTLCHVSFYEAAAYAMWKGMRLPTEFEWEAAAAKFDWGERWEWTDSAYLPYPGFAKAPGAIGEYNGKFMVNQMVLRGASEATPPGHSRASYRNFFHPHLRWQYTGVRLAV